MTNFSFAGTCKIDFLEQFKGFDKSKFTLICWDAPGYGQSRPPPRYYQDYYKKDAQFASRLMEVIYCKTFKSAPQFLWISKVYLYLQVLNIEKYSMVGFSDGGRVAMMTAARFPSRVRKVVAWGCNAFITAQEKQVIKRIQDIDTWSSEVRRPLENIYGDELQDIWDSLTEVWVKSENIFREDLPKIECPVFILHGEKDPMVARHHADYFKQNILKCRVHRFPLAGHNLQQTSPVEFNQMVQEFLAA